MVNYHLQEYQQANILTTMLAATLREMRNSWANINCEMRQIDGGGTLYNGPKCSDDCSDLMP